MPAKKVMIVFGTRPEAIKMAPVVLALKSRANIQTTVVVTAQHREMLDGVLALFGISPDCDLNVMRADQGLDALFARVLAGVGLAIEREKPDLVLVHGDTSTTLASALAAFHARIPVGHVEAGLRTGDLDAPWPEEGNRRLVAPLARYHFAPTERARANLLAEGIPQSAIHVTGNTVIDALRATLAKVTHDPNLARARDAEIPHIPESKRLILVTGHRRESFGAGLESICEALLDIASRTDAHVVYPVHPNPAVQKTVNRILGQAPNVALTPPLDYLPFAQLMARATLIITDSGGIQEEAPGIGVPVLVTRDTTERPEAIEAGTVVLVGTDRAKIVATATRLLENKSAWSKMAKAHNPYGDGQAAERIAAIVEKNLQGL